MNLDITASQNVQLIKLARLINPSDKFYQAWQFVILFALFYCATIMPYKVCFVSKTSKPWLIFDTFIDFIFLADMIVVLNTPYVNEKKQ